MVFHFIIFRLYLTFFEAVLLILKHATVLRLSQGVNSALAQADLDYQKAKIDLTIQQHPLAYSPEDTVEQFIGFIMATEIGEFVLLSVTIISHQAFSAISVFSISVITPYHIQFIYLFSLLFIMCTPMSWSHD